MDLTIVLWRLELLYASGHREDLHVTPDTFQAFQDAFDGDGVPPTLSTFQVPNGTKTVFWGHVARLNCVQVLGSPESDAQADDHASGRAG